MTMKPTIASLLVSMLLTGAVSADTTVVKVISESSVYDEIVRVYIDHSTVKIECRNYLLDKLSEDVDPKPLLSALDKMQEWAKLNTQVKTNVTKRIRINPDAPRIATQVDAVYYGYDNGASGFQIGVGRSVCGVGSVQQIQTLANGIRNNLENAKAEDKLNKAGLFK